LGRTDYDDLYLPAVAVLGTIFGGLLVVSSIMQAGIPEISELSNR